MFTSRWQFLRLFGIPVYVHVSWLVILALLSWTLASFFRVTVPGFSEGGYWALGLVTTVGFCGCIVLHEFGHALVARSVGMPVRGITVFLFGGVAELGGEPASAWNEFIMAVAGPLVSAVLAAVFWALANVGTRQAWPDATVIILSYLASINAIVLLFNLVPAFPLDGGRVLRSALWGATGNLRRATHWAAVLGQAFAWLLIALGFVQLFRGPTFFLDAIWLGLIGLFLNDAAKSSYQQVLVRQALEGESVRHFMNPSPIVVPPAIDLSTWVEEYVYRHHRKSFPVASNGHIEGFISTTELSHYPRQEWPQHTVGEVMRHDLERVTVEPGTDALVALQKMQRTGSSRLLVTDHERLVGIVSLKDLLQFLNLKIGLKEGDEEVKL